MPAIFREDPYGGYNFVVNVNGISDDGSAARGLFTEVSGLESEVPAIEYRGAAAAAPAPGVVTAIQDADVVIIAPSNPPLSIWPILAVEGIAKAVQEHPKVVAVSPLIGGRAVKGPLVAVMEGLGVEPSNRGVLEMYVEYVTHFVIDESDAAEGDGLRSHSVRVFARPTLIKEAAAAALLAEQLLELATAPVPGPQSAQ